MPLFSTKHKSQAHDKTVYLYNSICHTHMLCIKTQPHRESLGCAKENRELFIYEE